jgi:hypothetical protein
MPFFLFFVDAKNLRGREHIFPISLDIARMTGACHCIQPWVEMGSHRLFVQAELEP